MLSFVNTRVNQKDVCQAVCKRIKCKSILDFTTAATLCINKEELIVSEDDLCIVPVDRLYLEANLYYNDQSNTIFFIPIQLVFNQAPLIKPVVNMISNSSIYMFSKNNHIHLIL